MIPTGQIVAVGLITGVAVAVAAAAVRWRVQWVPAAAFGAFLLIVAWRALSNLIQLNGDFLPAISVGDVGSLVAGSIAPAAVSVAVSVPTRLRWVPFVTGGVVGFVANVVII